MKEDAPDREVRRLRGERAHAAALSKKEEKAKKALALEETQKRWARRRRAREIRLAADPTD